MGDLFSGTYLIKFHFVKRNQVFAFVIAMHENEF